MATKQGGGKKRRATKTSKGIHGAGGKVPGLSRLELYLLGKGPTKAAEKRIYQESLKAPGARPAKGRS